MTKDELITAMQDSETAEVITQCGHHVDHIQHERDEPDALIEFLKEYVDKREKGEAIGFTFNYSNSDDDGPDYPIAIFGYRSVPNLTYDEFAAKVAAKEEKIRLDNIQYLKKRIASLREELKVWESV